MTPDGRGGLRVRVATSLKAVPAGAWNACAAPLALREALAPAAGACSLAAPAGLDHDNPFVSPCLPARA